MYTAMEEAQQSFMTDKLTGVHMPKPSCLVAPPLDLEKEFAALIVQQQQGDTGRGENTFEGKTYILDLPAGSIHDARVREGSSTA